MSLSRKKPETESIPMMLGIHVSSLFASVLMSLVVGYAASVEIMNAIPEASTEVQCLAMVGAGILVFAIMVEGTKAIQRMNCDKDN